MASGRELAKDYAARVQAWVAERDAAHDYLEYERGGKVNRAELCAELDFGRSVVSQNPTVRECLREAESRWYGPRETSSRAHDAARERAESKSNRSLHELSKTLDDVAKLKAENALLRKRLKKYEALEEILIETGRIPRA